MESHEARLLDEVVVQLHQGARVHTGDASDTKGLMYAQGLRDAADYLTLTLNEIRRGKQAPS